LALLIVAAIGLFLYRIVFQPLAHTSVLVLLIASVGCHLALQGFGLVFFGAAGQRGPTISMPPSPSGRCASPAKASPSTPSPSPSSSASGCFSALRSTARRCAPRRQSPRRAPGRHQDHVVGTDRVPAGVRDRAISGILIVPITTLYYDTGS